MVPTPFPILSLLGQAPLSHGVAQGRSVHPGAVSSWLSQVILRRGLPCHEPPALEVARPHLGSQELGVRGAGYGSRMHSLLSEPMLMTPGLGRRAWNATLSVMHISYVAASQPLPHYHRGCFSLHPTEGILIIFFLSLQKFRTINTCWPKACGFFFFKL